MSEQFKKGFSCSRHVCGGSWGRFLPACSNVPHVQPPRNPYCSAWSLEDYKICSENLLKMTLVLYHSSNYPRKPTSLYKNFIMTFAEKTDATMLERTSSNKENIPNGAEPETLAAVERPDPWGKGHRSLYLMCGLIYLCSTMNGMIYI